MFDLRDYGYRIMSIKSESDSNRHDQCAPNLNNLSANTQRIKKRSFL